MDYTIVAIKVDSREDNAVRVQNLLTKYGCNIKVRLGLHDIPTEACSSTGLILLEVTGKEVPDMVAALKALPGVAVKTLEI